MSSPHARRFPGSLLVAVALAIATAAGPTVVAAAPAPAAGTGPTPAQLVLGTPDRLRGFFPDVVYANHPFDVVVWISDELEELFTTGTSGTVTLAIETSSDPAMHLACPGGLAQPTNTTGPNAGVALFRGCTVDLTGTVVLRVTASAVVSTVMPTPVLAPDSSEPIPVEAATEAPQFTITIAVDGSRLVHPWGEPVTLRIRFDENGANRPFELQESPRTTSTWRHLADLVTDANGDVTSTVRPDQTTFYRVVFAGAPDLAAGSSHPEFVFVQAVASQRPVRSTPLVVQRGATVRFATTVRPVLRGPVSEMKVAFTLFHRVDGRWRLASRRTRAVDSLGVARLSATFAGRGEWYVRSSALGQGTTVRPVDGQTFIGVLGGSEPTRITRISVR
jgi:hypothetical protein